MDRVLRKLFNLYPGEVRNTLLFAFLAFIWSLGSYCGVTLSDGMFLEHVGAQQLPTVYLLTAVTLFLISTLLLLAFNYFNPLRIYLGSLAAGIIGFFLLYLNFPNVENEPTYWLVLKVFCNVFTVVLTTCYWFFIDQYYTLQTGKRLFTLFNATIFFGNACGGALLAFSLNSIGTKGLILLITFFLFGAFAWVMTLSKKVTPLQDDNDEGSETSEKISIKTAWKMTLRSRFTKLLMMAYLMIQLINIVTEYTYMQSFQQYFSIQNQDEGNAHELTTFLGGCTALIALANMLYGYFFYSRTVNRFGINNIVSVSSLCFLATFLGWSLTDALAISVLGIFVVEGVSYALDENNSNLLLNAVPPKLKNRVRVAIDSFFEPLGMFISALIFIFFDFASKEVGLLLTLICLASVFLLRKEYPKGILSNFLENAIHFEKNAFQWISHLSKKERKTAKMKLIGFLRQSDETNQLLAYEVLLKFNDPKLLFRLLNLFQKTSTRAKIKMLELLDKSLFSTEPSVIEKLQLGLRQRSNYLLKSSIHQYFAKRGLLPAEMVTEDIHSHDIALREAAILALTRDPRWHLFESYISHANQQLEQLLSSQKEQEVCRGIEILGLQLNSSNLEILTPFLNSPSHSICCSAIKSITKLINESHLQYGPMLISHLQSSGPGEFRIECLHALSKIASPSLVGSLIQSSMHFRPNEKRLLESIITKIGPEAVPIVLAITKDTHVHPRCRILAGRSLGRLALQLLRNNLHEIVGCEIERAYFYFFHCHSIQQQYPHLDLSLLQDTLSTSLESVLDFVIQLLGVAGSIEESDLLSRSLKSRNPKTRANAIETIEKTCETRIFHMIKPLVDERPACEKFKHCLKRHLQPLTLEVLLSTLESSSSTVDQIIAVSLKAKYNFADWRSTLKMKMETNQDVFHHFAYELLET